MTQYTAPPSTQVLSITTAAAEIAALAADIGTYSGDNDIATDLDTAEASLAALATDVGTYSGAASVAADLDTAEATLASVVTDATSTQAFLQIPLTAWTDGGAPLSAFVDGSVNGLALVDSEALCFRFNPVGEDTSTLWTSIPMPADYDDAAAVVLHVMAFRIGSADTDTVLTGNAFFQTVGAAHTADNDCLTSNSAALDAATTVVQEVTLSIAAGDTPAHPASLSISFAPDSALDADDLCVTATWLEYTRKLRTS